VRYTDLMTISIRPYRASDFDSLYAMWGATLGGYWPLTPAYLRHMVSGYARYKEGDHFVAEQDGRVAGFVATQNDGKAGGIPFLIVWPINQRRGIGKQLHTAAMEHLRGQGIDNISLAHGGGDYFWPGVPLDRPGAVDFFKACGWSLPYTCYDMTQNLAAYQTPVGVLERAARLGIDFRLCTSSDEATAVVAFEQRVFPFWAQYFQMNATPAHFDSILAAWDGDTVVGALLLEKADIEGFNPGGVWHLILGDHMGSIGAVGVDEVRQGQGIGLAMVAVASEILQKRGVQQCIIGWTDLLGFYGRLGYREWRAYAMTED
jgi:ribosomal protein S18 acetylase RimI-like enzyme